MSKRSAKPAKYYLFIYSLPVTVMLLTISFGLTSEVNIGEYFCDPAIVVGRSPFLGAFTAIGSFIWMATSTICIFTAFVIKDDSKHKEWMKFLISIGLFTAILMIDDFFVLHDHIFPWFFGITEIPIFISYLICTIILLFRFRTIILESRYKLLFTALTLFSLSMFVDLLGPFVRMNYEINESIMPVTEDVFKFVAIFGWLGYFSVSSYDLLSSKND